MHARTPLHAYTVYVYRYVREHVGAGLFGEITVL